MLVGHAERMGGIFEREQIVGLALALRSGGIQVSSHLRLDAEKSLLKFRDEGVRVRRERRPTVAMRLCGGLRGAISHLSIRPSTPVGFCDLRDARSPQGSGVSFL